MSKRKPMDKEQARERRNRLLETAGAAELSITEGVREMRAIAGMTQEEFARHRGVSARVIKGIELGQANPTMATLNQIGQFFGLEVAFVPTKRKTAATGPHHGSAQTTQSPSSSIDLVSGNTLVQAKTSGTYRELAEFMGWEAIRQTVEARESILATMRHLSESLNAMDQQLEMVDQVRKTVQARIAPVIEPLIEPLRQNNPAQEDMAQEPASTDPPRRKKKKTDAP